MNNSILPSIGPYTRPSGAIKQPTSNTRHSKAEMPYMSHNEISLHVENKQLREENRQLRNRPEKPQEVELQRQLTAAQKTIRSQIDLIRKLTSIKPKGYVPCPVRADNGSHKDRW
jgi:hypothetical protein